MRTAIGLPSWWMRCTESPPRLSAMAARVKSSVRGVTTGNEGVGIIPIIAEGVYSAGWKNGWSNNIPGGFGPVSSGCWKVPSWPCLLLLLPSMKTATRTRRITIIQIHKFNNHVQIYQIMSMLHHCHCQTTHPPRNTHEEELKSTE